MGIKKSLDSGDKWAWFFLTLKPHFEKWIGLKTRISKQLSCVLWNFSSEIGLKLLHPQRSTLHPQRSTIHSQRSTLHPKDLLVPNNLFSALGT